MSKSDRLNKELDHISKMIMFLIAMIFLIIAYAYQNRDLFAILATIAPLAGISHYSDKQSKDLKELEDE